MTPDAPEPLPPPPKRSAGLFWFLLALPPVVSLLTYGLIHTEYRDATVISMMFVGPIVSLISALYCGIWLARLVPTPGGVRILAGFAAVLLLLALDVFLTFIGCITGVRF